MALLQHQSFFVQSKHAVFFTENLVVFLVTPQKKANATNGQTFGGNSSKINLAHILKLGRP